MVFHQLSSQITPIFIIGPTASGKSSLALTLAEKVSGHIIGADAMQLYQGMDIGTAKTPVDQRRGITHHLIDIWQINQQASVAQYQHQAQQCIQELLADNITPIVVGGSMLYVQSLLDNWSFPETNPTIRAELEHIYHTQGLEPLREKLAQLDPNSWEKILPTDNRRIIRALEVILSTGKKYQPHRPEHDQPPQWNSIIIGIDQETPQLDTAIEKRTEKMFSQGFVSEVQNLMTHGLAESPTASKAIGYAQVMAALVGKSTIEQAHIDTVQLTKRYVRRQRSWFRRDKRTVWLDGSQPLQMLTDHILEQYRHR